MDHERRGFTFVHTHQDGTALSTFVFDRRIGLHFEHWRRLGHPFIDKRRRNDLEGLLSKGGHCCNQFQIRELNISSFRQLPSLILINVAAAKAATLEEAKAELQRS